MKIRLVVIKMDEANQKKEGEREGELNKARVNRWNGGIDGWKKSQ